MKPIDPKQNPPSQDPASPTQSEKTAMPAQPAKSAASADSTKNATPTQPPKGVGPTQPEKSAVPSESVWSATLTQPEKGASVEPAKIAARTQAEKSATLTQPDKGANPVEAVKSVTPTAPDKSATPAQPEKSASAVEPVKSAVATRPGKSAMPVPLEESATQIDLAKSAVPVQPVESAMLASPEESAASTNEAKAATPMPPEVRPTLGEPEEGSATRLAAGNERSRVVVESVRPAVDGGRYPIKRTIGEVVVVEADVFTDGHDAIRCLVLYQKEGALAWSEASMSALGNDAWCASFVVSEVGRYRYTVCGWVDHFVTWRNDLARRNDLTDIALALRIGASLVEAAAKRASGSDQEQLARFAQALISSAPGEGKRLGSDSALGELMERYADRRFASTYEKTLTVLVDRERARFSTWYEMFPRSCVPEGGSHGTFRECVTRLPYIAGMGFDVLYLPPIHPIGNAFRKGKNNALVATAGDVGSPWAIGAAEGGHKAVLRELGTLEDFCYLVAAASERGIEIALDIAFQCSPDHPYVKEHPSWFRWRPDGSVQYAENPPKKYQDIYPFDFETEDWRALWDELRSVFLFWIEQGVRIFRVDNPHTKPFAMWEWLIDSVTREHPDVIFLSEAFTRPKIMHRLSKLGFTQSYTYFAWRNTKHELTEYFTELTKSASREYFRPNAWPNTPDILTEFLQVGGRGAFMLRVALAATLAASYGIYGPAYELLEHRPREHGSEEYLNSEKYQIRAWDLGRADSLCEFIGLLNRIRLQNVALQSDWSLRFHHVDNGSLICYSKATPDLSNVIVVVANLDPHHVQAGWVELGLQSLGLTRETPYQMHDLITGARYVWHGSRNFVQLEPRTCPVHVFRVRRKLRTERDFDYFV